MPCAKREDEKVLTWESKGFKKEQVFTLAEETNFERGVGKKIEMGS